VAWTLVTYPSPSGTCVDVLGYLDEEPIGGPGGCGGFDSELESLLSQAPFSALPSWAVTDPPSVRMLSQGSVRALAKDGGSTMYAVLGATVSCDCSVHVVWIDGIETELQAVGGFFLAWHEIPPSIAEMLGPGVNAVVTVEAG